MPLTVREITAYLETIAPLSYQESYDNSGLLLGSYKMFVNKVIITLDVTEKVLEEAIAEGANLVIAHHPLIFKGLKKITDGTEVERTVSKAIKNDIAVYALHTNLDNIAQGVNRKLAEKLMLRDLQVLMPQKGTLKKLVTFVPKDYTEKVCSALFAEGAGNIGNYSNCSYQMEGRGTFLPGDNAQPSIGKKHQLESVIENRIEVIFPAHKEKNIVAALKAMHPYEEPAYDLISLNNINENVGAGMIGTISPAMEEKAFLLFVKEKLNLEVIRHSPLCGAKVEKVAICGGAGSFLLKEAISQQAAVFITGDFKYHEFFEAENKIVIADVGHYESEESTKELISEILIKKFSNIAIVLAKTVTNPISYLK